jgi:hypothetical protein
MTQLSVKELNTIPDFLKREKTPKKKVKEIDPWEEACKRVHKLSMECRKWNEEWRKIKAIEARNRYLELKATDEGKERLEKYKENAKARKGIKRRKKRKK